MTVPSGGYANWAGWLDAFARGEDRPTTGLVPVDESLGPAVNARLLNRIAAAFTRRTGLWSQTLDRRISAATRLGGLPELAATLVTARAGLRPVWALADCALLPAELRTELRRALTEMLEQTQRSLEDSARRELDGEELLALLREHRLTVAAPAVAPATPVPARAPGRRVIL